MARCHGTTLEGERCKREAQDGMDYCAIHEDQAPEGGRGRGSGGPGWDTDTLVKTAVGFALLGAIVLFRIKR